MDSKSFHWAAQGVTLSYDVVGEGPDLLLLPALSTISTRAEMHPLASRLADRFRCVIPDWPGFGNAPRPRLDLSPALMRRFLDDVTAAVLSTPAGVLAAGHGATYAAMLARERPEALSRLVLVAPTWRGPLPTAMGENRRPLWDRIRRLVETPAVGSLLYALNVNPPVIRRMMRAHVYGTPENVTPELVTAKAAVTRRARARFATAAFVTGGLDPVLSRDAFLALFRPPPVPTLVIRGERTPARSGAEMDALAALPGIETRRVPGALSPHEEHPDAVAAAAEPFLLAESS